MTNIIRFPASRTGRIQYLQELRSIYGLGGVEIPDPDYALANDPAIYTKIERDPIIRHSLQHRTLSVIGQSWHLEPPTDSSVDKAGAEVGEELIGRIVQFGESRRNLFHAGLLGGRGYSYVAGRRAATRIAGHRGRWWVPRRLQHLDKRQFRFQARRGERDETTGRTPVRQVLQVARLEEWNRWDDLTPSELRGLVRLTYNNRADRIGQGEGLGAALYVFFRAKGIAVRDLFAANEKWGRGGLTTVKVDPNREASKGKSNDVIVNEYLDKIDKMMSRHVLVMEKGDEIDVISPSNEGTQLILDTIEYIDKCITRLITGALRPTGGDTETGARAQGEVEQESQDVLVQADRQLLDDALTEHMVRCVWSLNRARLIELGLGDAAMPRFRTAVERRADPAAAIAVISQAVQAGIPLPKKEVYDRLGFTQPAEGEDVFEGSPPTPIPGIGQPSPFAQPAAADE